jgi:hypothetical protein
MRDSINNMNDIAVAIGVIFTLGLVALFKVEQVEVITVLSYVVTAIGSLATGRALR